MKAAGTGVAKFPDGQPQYLYDLIAVVKAKGKQSIEPGMKRSDFSTTHTYKGVEVTEEAGVTKIKQEKYFDIGQEHPGYRENQMEVHKAIPEVKDEGLETQKLTEATDEYFEGTLRPDPNDPGKFVDDMDAISEADHLELKKIADEAKDLAIKKASGGRVPLGGGKLALDVLRKMIIKKYKGRIDDNLLKKILVDDNQQRIHEILATIDEALIMQGKGMKPDDIMQTFRDSWKRKKQASGGIAGQLHLNQGGRVSFTKGGLARILGV